MSTYLVRYEDHLVGLIDKGGSEVDVENALREYNKPSSDGLDAWVKAAGLVCAYCDQPAKTDEYRPTDEVTCAEHREPGK